MGFVLQEAQWEQKPPAPAPSSQDGPRQTCPPQPSGSGSISVGAAAIFAKVQSSDADQERPGAASQAQSGPPPLQQLHGEKDDSTELCVF